MPMDTDKMQKHQYKFYDFAMGQIKTRVEILN